MGLLSILPLLPRRRRQHPLPQLLRLHQEVRVLKRHRQPRMGTGRGNPLQEEENQKGGLPLSLSLSLPLNNNKRRHQPSWLGIWYMVLRLHLRSSLPLHLLLPPITRQCPHRHPQQGRRLPRVPQGRQRAPHRGYLKLDLHRGSGVWRPEEEEWVGDRV